MKYYEDFKREGHSFAERVGDPDELHAAMGSIALSFSYLEDTARNVIVLLSGTDSGIGHILTAGMSFRQKLDVLASLAQYRLAALAGSTKVSSDAEARTETVRELIMICRRAEELRNTYLHSSYGRGERAKLAAGPRHGIRFFREPIDAALLLDVADFIHYVGSELEALPLIMGIADALRGDGYYVSYSKNGSEVATFRFGELA